MLRIASLRLFHRALVFGAFVGAAGLSCTAAARAADAPARAVAQAASPSPSPVATAPAGEVDKSRTGVPEPPVVAKHRTDYMPAIDILPQSTFATGSDYTPGEPQDDGPIKIGGKFAEALIGNLNVSYQHGYIDETVGNAPAPGNYLVDDPTDDFRLNYAATKSLGISLGYFYRHRTCCPAANNPTNEQPISVHQGYLELDYAFPAIESLNGATFSISARATQTLAHKPAPAAFLAANTNVGPDGGNRFLPSAGGTLTVPIDRRNGLSVFGTYTYAFDYFDYQAIPWFYNIVDYGFTKTVSPTLSFTLDTSNLHEHLEGNPFPGLNVIHRTKVVLSADVHLGRH